MRAKLLTVSFLFSVASAHSLLADQVGTVNQLVVFGDSLSDNGNAAIALGGKLPGNYAPNAFTDGPNTSPATAGPFGLWVDQLAPKLGVADPTPFLTGGANFAVASALSGHNPLFTASFPPTQVPYTSDQLALFSLLNGGVASSNALYTFWAGSNDLFSGAVNPLTAADNDFNNIEALAAMGGKHFLWLNLPPLGNTPFGVTHHVQVPLDAAAAAYDAEWAFDLAKLKAQGIDVIGVDIQALYAQIAANPAAFGFTDICDSAQGLNGVNPNQYLFWDDAHPTTAADALIATTAFNAFVAAPEPASVGMALTGLFGLLAVSRLRRRNSAA